MTQWPSENAPFWSCFICIGFLFKQVNVLSTTRLSVSATLLLTSISISYWIQGMYDSITLLHKDQWLSIVTSGRRARVRRRRRTAARQSRVLLSPPPVPLAITARSLQPLQLPAYRAACVWNRTKSKVTDTSCTFILPATPPASPQRVTFHHATSQVKQYKTTQYNTIQCNTIQ